MITRASIAVLDRTLSPDDVHALARALKSDHFYMTALVSCAHIVDQIEAVWKFPAGTIPADTTWVAYTKLRDGTDGPVFALRPEIGVWRRFEVPENTP